MAFLIERSFSYDGNCILTFFHQGSSYVLINPELIHRPLVCGQLVHVPSIHGDESCNEQQKQLSEIIVGQSDDYVVSGPCILLPIIVNLLLSAGKKIFNYLGQSAQTPD